MRLKYAGWAKYIKVIETWAEYFDEHLSYADNVGMEDQSSQVRRSSLKRRIYELRHSARCWKYRMKH